MQSAVRIWPTHVEAVCIMVKVLLSSLSSGCRAQAQGPSAH